MHGHLGRVDPDLDRFRTADALSPGLFPGVPCLAAGGLEVLGVVAEVAIDVLLRPGLRPAVDGLQYLRCRIGGRLLRRLWCDCGHLRRLFRGRRRRLFRYRCGGEGLRYRLAYELAHERELVLRAGI